MATINLQNIRDELCNGARNADVFGANSKTIRGVTNSTYTATATASQTIITLPHVPVKNIVSFTVAGTSQRLFEHYSINWNTGVITMVTGMTVGQAISINYDYGNSDKIFPDYPRDDLTLTSYPRVGMEITSMRSEPLGLGGMNHITSIILTIYVWVSANKDTSIASGFGGLNDLNTAMYNLRNAVLSNCKSFYTIPYIKPVNTGPLIKGKNDKILQQSQDFELKFLVE